MELFEESIKPKRGRALIVVLIIVIIIRLYYIINSIGNITRDGDLNQLSNI